MSLERFLNKVYPEPNTGCWIWSGGLDPEGYGKIHPESNSGFARAHRYSYFLHNNINPKENFVMHKCDNRWCVNPDHLSLGTTQDNTRDRHGFGRW